MAGKIKINTERCKGCGLCVIVCPKECIVISEQSNKKGYFPAKALNKGCTGCGSCALICPEAVIEVLKENNIVGIESNEKKKTLPTEEKI